MAMAGRKPSVTVVLYVVEHGLDGAFLLRDGEKIPFGEVASELKRVIAEN